MKIAKSFHWEMGHRLIHHNGSCRNMHGHSYRLEVELEGDVDPVTGMVLDFQEISRMVKPVVAELDHAFLCFNQDTGLITFLEQHGMKKVVVDFESTSENICRFFLAKISPALAGRKNLRRVRVTVQETASSRATMELEL